MLDAGITPEQKKELEEHERHIRDKTDTPANSQDTQKAQCNEDTMESGDEEMVATAKKDSELLQAIDSRDSGDGSFDMFAPYMPRQMRNAYIKKRALHEMKRIADANQQKPRCILQRVDE